MKIIITGVTGFIGTMLVPLLAERGVDLLLVGRSRERLESQFPGIPSCEYVDLEQHAGAADLLLHLAVLNSNASDDAERFNEINAGHARDVAAVAARSGVGLFVFPSSLHALQESNASNYAASKRLAKTLIDEVTGIRVATVYMPAVYGSRWAGRWKFLNSMPGWLSRSVFVVLSALMPTLNVSKLASYLMTASAAPSETILTDGQQSNPVYRVARRLGDLTFALAVIALLWWAMLLVWITIRVTSPGPGVFAQQRVGRGGRTFTCYKFRTMKVGTAEVATNQVSASAVTDIGHFLRRSKLDELPQVWNIIRNEVSLVGPRPCLPSQLQLIDERGRRGVLELKPGITGLSQIHDIDMSDPVRLAESDARYRALQSLVLDLKILISTAMGRGRGDRVSK